MQWTMGQSISFILILLIRLVGLCIHFGKLQSQFSSEPILCIVNTNPITFNKANVSIQKYYICTGIEVTRYWSSLSSFPTKKLKHPCLKKKKFKGNITNEHVIKDRENMFVHLRRRIDGNTNISFTSFIPCICSCIFAKSDNRRGKKASDYRYWQLNSFGSMTK